MSRIYNNIQILFNTKGRHLLIYVNIFIYIFFNILYIICLVLGKINIFYIIQAQFVLPLYYKYALEKPWTIITYSFFNDSLLILAVSIVIINIFGKIIEDYINKKNLFMCYIGSSMISALTLLVFYNLSIEIRKDIFIIDINSSSSACISLVFASLKLLPSFNINKFPFNNVKIKFLAIIIFILYFVLLDYRLKYLMLNILSALFGYLFIRYLQNR